MTQPKLEEIEVKQDIEITEAFQSQDGLDAQTSFDPMQDQQVLESHPKVIVTQVPDGEKFFSNQVFEIQFIEVPIQSMIKHS